MELPKQLKKDNIELEVQAALDKESIALYSESETQISVLTLNHNMRQQIFFAKSMGDVILGLEPIEKSLENELRGLQKTDNKSERVSRLLLVTNDGSKSFYQGVEYLLQTQVTRLMVCRLDIDAKLMGNILGLKNQKVKAVLLNSKKAVINVLKSIV